MRGLQTTVRVVSPHGRGSKKALAYFLGLNKKALISSLKSATNTEASAMNKLSMSIMDSLYVDSAHKPNLITKKKPSSLKESWAFHIQGSSNLF